MKRTWRYLFIWSVTVFLMIWVFHRVPWKEVWINGTEAKPFPILVACALSLLGNVWAACQKYRLILKSLGTPLGFREVVLLKVGSIPLKNLLPFKSGEALRVIYLRRTHGLSYLRGGASLVMNLGWSLVALGLLVIPGYLIHEYGFISWAFAAFLGLFPVFTIRALVFYRNSVGPENKASDKASIIQRAWKILEGQSSGDIARILWLSFIFEGIKVLNYGIIFYAMGISISWEMVLQTAPLLVLISSLPISVMGLGIREGGLLVVFAGVAGNADLVSVGLWVSVVEGIVPLVLGLVLLKYFLTRLMDGDHALS